MEVGLSTLPFEPSTMIPIYGVALFLNFVLKNRKIYELLITEEAAMVRFPPKNSRLEGESSPGR
jgi:hypothetical protein